MATGKSQIQQLARQLFKLSLVDGRLSEEQVAGVLGYIEKNQAVNAVAILKAYHRLVSAEIARGSAIVEHSGPISDTLLASIAGALSQRYHRPVTATARENPALLAGLRVRIGDDLFESSVSGQLAALSASV
ncbi:MAG: F0F1 ATP synthase subunit delta [Opitutaceae bacterium]|jgi:F-type H+-transporting ATPase subunit delta